MIEFSHEANAAMYNLMQNLKILTDTTVNTRAAQVSAEKDLAGFLHRLGRASLAAVRAFELFVAAVSDSARTTGVFPTIVPRRPQPAAPTTVAMIGASPAGKASFAGLAGALTRSRSQVGLGVPPGDAAAAPPSAAPPNAAKTARAATNSGVTALSVPTLRTARSGSTADNRPPDASLSPRSNATAAAPTPLASTTFSATKKSAAGGADGTMRSAESPQQIIAIGAYLLIDVLVRETLAREAVWYAVPEGAADEAHAVALYSSKPRAPSAARVPLRTGVVGAVIRSGIAANISPETPSDGNPLALCFPIFPPCGRTHPIGAIILYHKASEEAFTTVDEATTANWTILAGRYMTDYGVDLTAVHFDPFRTLMAFTSPTAALLKNGYSATAYDVATRQNAEAAAVQSESKLLSDLLCDAARLIEVQAEEQTGSTFADVARKQQLYAKAANMQSYSSRLATAVAQFPPPFNVFHTVHHNHFTAVRGARLGGAGVTLKTQNLLDVAEYVQNLEDMWKRTTEDLHGIEQEHVAQMEDFRNRKRKLKAAQCKNTELEHQKQSLESKYEHLKVELSAICGRPIGDEVAAAAEASTLPPIAKQASTRR